MLDQGKAKASEPILMGNEQARNLPQSTYTHPNALLHTFPRPNKHLLFLELVSSFFVYNHMDQAESSRTSELPSTKGVHMTMNAFDEEQAILDGLNERQREAVTTLQGPVLILAGPGSGKTRVITQRIAYLVQHEGILPWQIIAVTFTNRAAKEMRERLEQLVGSGSANAMTVGTFHAICARILRMEANYLNTLGLDTSFVIRDSDDQRALIKRAVKELQLDEMQYKPSLVATMISHAKGELLLPSDMERQATTELGKAVAHIYRSYQKLLKSNNSVDFDDLLALTVRLWIAEPTILRHYQQLWHYVNVDEFQDCNRPQYMLLRLLSYGSKQFHEGRCNICAVGDDDQMIYSWRGASTETILRFERDFPNTRIILLEQNYRSTQVILDAAQNIVQHNSRRKAKRIWTQQRAGELIVYREATDEQDEGYFVASEIMRLRAINACNKYNEVAVMYRTNAQSRVLEEQLLHASIPYRVIGSRKFYERKEIKDLLAYLRLLVNPRDDLSLQRVINVPNRKIGAKTLEGLQRWARDKSVTLYEAVSHVKEISSLQTAAQNAVSSFAHLLDTLLRQVPLYPLPELLDCILEKSTYGNELHRQVQEGLDPWSNVLELRRLAADYAQLETKAALDLFLENIALVSGADTTQSGDNGVPVAEKKTDAVTLITLHAAKGLEYPTVFIIGMDEGSIPHARATDTIEQMEEERRLAYVGFTRAMRRLYLVRASRRALFGEYQDTEPSRFLADLPDILLSKPEQGATTSAHSRSREIHVSEAPAQEGQPTQSRLGISVQAREVGLVSPSLASATVSPSFKAGVKVMHVQFGEGIVLKSELLDGTVFVDVQFRGSAGKKRLSLDFERLERV